MATEPLSFRGTSDGKQMVAEASPSEEVRMENTVVNLPIVYGSIAFQLASSNKKAMVSDSTHEWTLYLRGPNNEDLSQCIEKAVFQLHPSFSQPVRELTAAPFEVTERGWGEFEAQIKISWKDSREKTTMVTHGLKLYPPPPDPNDPTPQAEQPADAPVVAESYDEVVFTNPTESFFEKIQRIPMVPSIEYKHQSYFNKYSDVDDFLALLEARKFVAQELDSVKERFELVNSDLEKADVELREAQEKAKAAAAATANSNASNSTKNASTTRSLPSSSSAAQPATKKSKTSGASTATTKGTGSGATTKGVPKNASKTGPPTIKKAPASTHSDMTESVTKTVTAGLKGPPPPPPRSSLKVNKSATANKGASVNKGAGASANIGASIKKGAGAAGMTTKVTQPTETKKGTSSGKAKGLTQETTSTNTGGIATHVPPAGVAATTKTAPTAATIPAATTATTSSAISQTTTTAVLSAVTHAPRATNQVTATSTKTNGTIKAPPASETKGNGGTNTNIGTKAASSPSSSGKPSGS